ncbi:DsbA family protein [Paenibacillus sp. DMB5]|uniref:DsbA family oxidoreductase n=1 Tax=Paenibacillus sp. DMB5 TaxID=1780103 RepID=UPI00076BEFF0|nr:DsbA family protein [Paenibacillus sp. DMB5]KUP24020.1 dithiol-disulfide isomerase [Paenibacillus sp. DMB5]
MTDSNMMCDLETGVCGVAGEDPMQVIDLNKVETKVTLYYVTDPICSHCWALEPVLNRFIQEYGQYFDLKIVMGGLLPSWKGFSDGGNGIQKPADVAGHWREVGEHSRMPIDGSLWHTNPVLSSYPPSRVFKVIQSKHEGREGDFLRIAREAVFVSNLNIGEEQVLITLVDQLGLDGQQIVDEAALDSAQDLLDEDFRLSARLGVRGFPSIVVVNEENKGVKVVGARPLDTYVQALQQITPHPVTPRTTPRLSQLLEGGHKLFSKEIEVMYGLAEDKVAAFIESELPAGAYRVQHIMNEMYVEKLG